MEKIKTISLPSWLPGCILFLLLILLTGTAAFAQTKISGTVTNNQQKPVSGATIHVVKTARYTTTDDTGAFSIEAGQGDVIAVSYVGYAQKEVPVTSDKLHIQLEAADSQLENLVVIGYGKVRRKDLTGSISSISGDELRKTQPSTFDQALQGKVAGVVVQQISGQPGGGVSIQIHGVSSVNGNNSPLYVIDGVVIAPPGNPGAGSNPLNTINPSEIESIDVLKDASATAIYGSQATNGVIVISTKRGKSSPPTISYDNYFGYQRLPKRLPVVDLPQFASLLNARAEVWGFDARPEFANPQYLGAGTDWQQELFRSAPMQNHNLAINGGDTRTQYLLSLSYFGQDGIALGSNFKRYSVRLNLDNKTTNWLKIGTSLQLAHIKEAVSTTSNSVINTALSLTPDIPVKNLDGSWGGVTNTSGWVTPVPNPVGLAALNSDNRRRNQLFGNVYAEIQFYKDLSLRNEVSGNFDFATEDIFRPTYTFGKVQNTVNSSSYSSNQSVYTVVRNYFNYNHLFNNRYNVSATAGHEAQLTTFENVSASRQNFPSNNVKSISAGDATTAANSGVKGSGPALESYFGRLNLTVSDKYLLTGNLRRDGSSNFAEGRRWVTTYSGAFAWKLNNERFLKGAKFINELKLRVGYGVTNNQNIPPNMYTTLLTSVQTALSGASQFQSNLANPFISWEKTNNANAGLDGAFLNWKINFSLDVYNRKTDGLLLALPLPLFSGTTTGWSPGAMAAPIVNIGSMSNKGFDFRIGSTNISTKNFTWKTDVTLSYIENKVLSLGSGGASANLPQSLNGYVFGKTVVGQPMGAFYGYRFDGVFASPEDFKTHALPVNQSGNPYPVSPSGGGIWYGDRMYKDLNGDGVIDTRDQTYLGSPLPKYQLGFNNTFNYKNFDFNMFFSASIGNKVLNQLKISQNIPTNNTSYFSSVLDYAVVAMKDPNGATTDFNNFYVSNPATTIVGLRNDNTNENSRPSDLFIEDGSFVRCKTIALGYRVPEKLLSKVHVNACRVYATLSNAFIITKYSGMDPEIGSWNPLQAGWDNGYYPQPRIFTVGVNISLNK